MNLVCASIRASSVALLLGMGSFATISAAYAQCEPTAEQSRPIPLGVSGGNIDSIDPGDCCSGTLGSLVESGSNQFILSNSHILAARDKSQVVVQPGLADLGCSQDSSDQVADGVKFIRISKTRTNIVDAAIAQVIEGDVDSSGSILNIGNIAAGGAVAPRLKLRVQKMGRTTCLTEGRVTAVEVSVKVKYPNLCKIVFTGTAIFRHQIQIKPGTFSAAGDSGSLVVTTGSCPGAVGLLFAGGAHSTFANPMTAVLRKFNATMVGNSCKPTKTLLADASASAMDYRQQPQPSEMAVTVAVKQRHEAELLKMSGVTGSGVGLSAEGKAVIKVFVEKDTQAMRSSVPPFLETIPVEIEETGPVTAY